MRTRTRTHTHTPEHAHAQARAGAGTHARARARVTGGRAELYSGGTPSPEYNKKLFSIFSIPLYSHNHILYSALDDTAAVPSVKLSPKDILVITGCPAAPPAPSPGKTITLFNSEALP